MAHTLLISSIVMLFLGSALMAASDMHNRKKSESKPRYQAVEEELSDLKTLLSDEMYQKVYNDSLSDTGKYKNYVSVPQKPMPTCEFFQSVTLESSRR